MANHPESEGHAEETGFESGIPLIHHVNRPKEWVRRNIDLVCSRTNAGALALFIGQLPTPERRGKAFAQREVILARIRKERAKKSEERNDAPFPAEQAAELSPSAWTYLRYMWDREGTVVPHAEFIERCSKSKKLDGGSKVLAGVLKKARKRYAELDLGCIGSVMNEEYLYLSPHRTGMGTEVLQRVLTQGGKPARHFAKLSSVAPEILPAETLSETAPGERDAEALQKKTASDISRINRKGNGDFLVQADRGQGYRMLTAGMMHPAWLEKIRNMKLWARETDILLHFLTKPNTPVRKEELLCFFPDADATEAQAFRTFMNRFVAKMRSNGIRIGASHKEHESGRPLEYYVLEEPEAQLPAEPEEGTNQLDRLQEHAVAVAREREAENMRRALIACREWIRDASDDPAICLDERLSASLEDADSFADFIGKHSNGMVKSFLQSLRNAGMPEPTDLRTACDAYETHHRILFESCRLWALSLFNAYVRNREYDAHRRQVCENAALMGLSKAVDKFSSSFGTRLSTYSKWWIEQSMQREDARDNRRRKTKNEHGETHRVLSMDRQLGHDDDGSTLGSTLEDPAATDDAPRNAMRSEARTQIGLLLKEAELSLMDIAIVCGQHNIDPLTLLPPDPENHETLLRTVSSMSPERLKQRYLRSMRALQSQNGVGN